MKSLTDVIPRDRAHKTLVRSTETTAQQLLLHLIDVSTQFEPSGIVF